MTLDEATNTLQRYLQFEDAGIRHMLRVTDNDITALRLLLSHAIPREDRERALDLAIPDYDPNHNDAGPSGEGCDRCTDLDEARRLLKLEAEP